jgi:hypothetical protein
LRLDAVSVLKGKHIQLGPVDRGSPYFRTSTPTSTRDKIYKPSKTTLPAKVKTSIKNIKKEKLYIYEASMSMHYFTAIIVKTGILSK